MNKKTTHEILSKLEETGELAQLVRAGYCHPCTFSNLNVFRYVDARMNTGDGKSKAVLCAAEAFDMGVRQIYRVLKTFKEKRA